MLHTPLLVIFNPAAGRGVAAGYRSTVEHQLARSGLAFDFVATSAPGDAERLAQTAHTQGYGAVVAAGGDGTINEIVNGLRHSALPLGLIPLGTGNDLAKMIGLRPNDSATAIARLRLAQPCAIDFGLANNRAFVNGMGIGFDAAIAVEAHKPSRLKGNLVYLQALLTTFRHYQAPVITATFNGHTTQRPRLLVAIGNGRCQGGGFWITPEAQINDGLLDVCLIDRLSPSELLRHLPKVLRGSHTKLRQVTMARTTHLQIDSATPLPVHLDGEILGTDLHHLTISIQAGALRVLR